MDPFAFCQSVLLIGNGFDRHCGLKTSYIDVYKKYYDIPSDNPLIKKFKDDIKTNQANWSDFEFNMSRYAKEFNSEDDFIECLNDFAAYMHQYLIDEQNEYIRYWNKTTKHTNTLNSFIESLDKLGYGVTHNIDGLLPKKISHSMNTIGFLSFNYTRVFDILLEFAFDNYLKPIHVNGRLGDDPILGMDRESQIDAKFDISEKLKLYFIKPYFNEKYDSERIKQALQIIKNANYVFVYGASLGESDLSWREVLVNWLIASENHHLFLYLHRNENKIFNYSPQKLDYELSEKNRILKEWNIKKDEFPIDRLHIPCGIKLFNLKDALIKDISEATKP